MASKINIKLIKSLIGSNKKQKATAYALGLRKIGDIVQQPNNEATQGKVKKIIHLVDVSK